MGAFNDIQFTHTCPDCGKESLLRCQTHIASSFSGDDDGRFCHHTYAIGQKMRWWPESDPRYKEWNEGTYLLENDLPENEAAECCYLDCGNCGAELYAIIRFKDCTPIAVVGVGVERNWPDEYYR